MAKYHKTRFHVMYLPFKVSGGLVLYNFWDEGIIDLEKVFVLGEFYSLS